MQHDSDQQNLGEPGGRFVYRGLCETVTERSVNEASLCMRAVWGELGGRAPWLGTVNGRSYQDQDTGSKTDFGPWSDCSDQPSVLNRTQSSVVTGLLIGHNTLIRHLHLMGLTNNNSCKRCDTEEKISVHVPRECEALASLRHAYLGSFFLDPEDIKSLRAIWNFSKGTRIPWIGIIFWGSKGPSNGQGVSGLKGLEPSYYLYLHLTELDWVQSDFHKDKGGQPTCQTRISPISQYQSRKVETRY